MLCVPRRAQPPPGQRSALAPGSAPGGGRFERWRGVRFGSRTSGGRLRNLVVSGRRQPPEHEREGQQARHPQRSASRGLHAGTLTGQAREGYRIGNAAVDGPCAGFTIGRAIRRRQSAPTRRAAPAPRAATRSARRVPSPSWHAVAPSRRRNAGCRRREGLIGRRDEGVEHGREGEEQKHARAQREPQLPFAPAHEQGETDRGHDGRRLQDAADAGWYPLPVQRLLQRDVQLCVVVQLGRTARACGRRRGP
jgi:hypothetical protein